MGRDQRDISAGRIKLVMSIPSPVDSESQWVMRAVQTQRIDPSFRHPLPEGISIEKADSLRKRADTILEEFQGRDLVDTLANKFKGQSITNKEST